MKVFSADYFHELRHEAAASPRLRQHRNIHLDYQDPCQRLFNAIEPNSYIRPHRHFAVPRDEMLIAVRGLMVLITFDDGGQIRHAMRFGSEKYGNALSAGAEVPSDTWHTVIALKPASVLLELKAGPFDPNQPKELASWAPEESSIEASQYLRALAQRVSID